ncbi:MAG: fumarylacetoacetate hydrolase family protein [Trueperaceae bacterium]|nr:fumarylacetoacetate hydrolase family protein [Trueperaceae bacterium]
MQRIRFRSTAGVAWGELEGGDVHVLAGPLGRRTGEVLAVGDVGLLAPADPTSIVCVGKNYADHVAEMGGDRANLPSEPGLFLKSIGTLAGPGDPIRYPTWTDDLQYEGELAVVIGREMRDVPADRALEHVLGYTIAIDVTARDKQRSDLQWVRAKSADGFCPTGPWLETDLDPGDVRLQTLVNGEVRQDARTRDLIFGVPEVLAYVSSFLTLRPGDLVLTGTPEGVGPLAVGDAIEVRIEGIGALHADVEAG